MYLGAPHASSALHDEVIAKLDAGHGEDELEQMRDRRQGGERCARSSATSARTAMALHESHEAIESMHADLVGEQAHLLAELAREHGARGWKVNGAGGHGGSMAVLGPEDPEADAALIEAIRNGASGSCSTRRSAWPV